MSISIFAIINIILALYWIVQIYKLSELRRKEVLQHIVRWRKGRSDHRSVFALITERTKFRGLKKSWSFTGTSADLAEGIVEMMQNDDATAEIIEEAVRRYKILYIKRSSD